MKSLLLKVDNVSKNFGAVSALKGVSFEIGAGEIVGLLGGNGAGKSTLTKILSGFHKPDSGRVIANGKIETVFQDQALAADLNVAQNIFLGREKTRGLGLLDSKGMEQEARELLDQLGVALPDLSKEVRFCSGGERQGIALSRAIYFEADLVLLDEPMTALSNDGRKKILKLIETMRSEKGISLIVISHDIERIYPLCDRFVVMYQGEKRAEVARDEVSLQELEHMLL